MKKVEHVNEANRIGNDSWWLMNFGQLPAGASAKRQVEALRQDKEWQRRKYEETSRAIDYLIESIEFPARQKSPPGGNAEW